MNATQKRNEQSALCRLAGVGVELDLDRDGRSFALYRSADRRRRAIARVSPAAMRSWLAAGLIEAIGNRSGYQMTRAGYAAAKREASPNQEFLAQHGDLVERQIMDEDGDFRAVRGFDPNVALRRLSAMRDAEGQAFFNAAELRAATLLRHDWERGLAGQVKGADWSAPPRGGIAHGPGIAAEAAMAAGCDARRRVEMALGRLAQPLRRAVERVCLYEEGIEALERGEGWPARSGKLALKLGLAQLSLGA